MTSNQSRKIVQVEVARDKTEAELLEAITGKEEM